VSRYFYPLAWLSGLILIDQATKVFVSVNWVNSHANSLFLIGGIPTLLVLAFLFRIDQSFPLRTTNYSLLTILAGGISNLIDRLLWGGVRDIFVLGTLYWNLADLWIVLGVAAALWAGFIHSTASAGD
jgi:lipoprotein signal peptidase